MFQLYKKRNFGDYISDTFLFLKIYGKHFFKNYFILNGGLLLLLTVLFYFIFKIYFEALFTSLNSNDPSFFENYFNNNIALVVTVFIVCFLLFIFLALLNFAYPTLYLSLLDKHQSTQFTIKDCLHIFKEKAFKIIIFFFTLLLLSFTVGIFIAAIVAALFFIVIGIPLLFILAPTLIAIVNVSFYIYMNNNIGVFQAFGQGIQYVKQNFLAISGSTLVIYIIIQVASTVFTMIPYLFGFINLVTTVEKSPETINAFGIIMIIVLCVGFIGTMILNNLLFINSGLIYYSGKEQNENIFESSTIDQIGQHHE